MLKKITLFLSLCAGLCMSAQDNTIGINVIDPSMTRNGSLMSVNLGLDFTGMKIASNRAAVFTPMIVNGPDTLMLPGVGVYGRTRWYQYERNDMRPVSGNEELAIRYKKDLEAIAYSQNVNYSDWMNGSELIVRRTDYGCAGCNEGELVIGDLAAYRMVQYEPVFYYQEAVAETVKTRELSGRAYVDFPVNKIVIYPDYRRNSIELAKIIGTIDSVKNDKDITVTALSIKGFASPEGPYDNNVRLAKGRTEALKDYVQNLYNFPQGFITTSYEPEDWEGLREYVVGSNIENKEGILAIIDSDLAPDPKNTKIQTTYPVQYKFLLQNVYPGLRHSDYRIEYNIRQFSDVAEIAELIKTAPQKLSLNEVYLLANSYQPGSDEYNEVFETAAILFPDDATANLNAANSAMQRGNLAAAERYLSKAGNSAQAVYARGVLAALQGDYNTGISLVEKALSMGLQDNQGVLEHMREAQKYAN